MAISKSLIKNFHLTGLFLIFISFATAINGQVSYPPQKEGTTVPGSNPMYMLTYDHGGLVLWGTDHFEKYLRSAIEWLDRYPGFKIGLDNEAYTYDFLLQLLRPKINILKGTTGQPLLMGIKVWPFSTREPWARCTNRTRVFHYLWHIQCIMYGKSGDQIQPFQIANAGITLSALYTQEGKPFIRFNESQGTKDELQLNYFMGSGSFTEVDLNGKEQTGKGSSLMFNPWQIKTFRLDMLKK